MNTEWAATRCSECKMQRPDEDIQRVKQEVKDLQLAIEAAQSLPTRLVAQQIATLGFS